MLSPKETGEKSRQALGFTVYCLTAIPHPQSSKNGNYFQRLAGILHERTPMKHLIYFLAAQLQTDNITYQSQEGVVQSRQD